MSYFKRTEIIEFSLKAHGKKWEMENQLLLAIAVGYSALWLAVLVADRGKYEPDYLVVD